MKAIYKNHIALCNHYMRYMYRERATLFSLFNIRTSTAQTQPIPSILNKLTFYRLTQHINTTYMGHCRKLFCLTSTCTDSRRILFVYCVAKHLLADTFANFYFASVICLKYDTVFLSTYVHLAKCKRRKSMCYMI